MNIRQERFANAYITNGGNAAAAARQAGYSEKGAKVAGARLLKFPDIRERISQHVEEIKSADVATREEVLIYLSSVLRGEVTDTVVLSSGKTVTLKVRTRERLRAAEMLLKVFGAFRDTQKDSATNSYLQEMKELESLDGDN